MKGINYFGICVLMLILISSCQDDTAVSDVSIKSEVSQTSRAITPIYFDWENVDVMPTPSGQARIDPPWHGQGALSYMYGDDVLTDIKASNGWELLYSTFDANATAPLENPYFVLYNKYRGIMRIYFYLTTEGFVSSSYLENELSVLSNQSSCLLNFLGKEFIDATEVTDTYVHTLLKTRNNTPPLASNRWYMMQYELAYDSNISQYQYNDIRLYWNLNYHAQDSIFIDGELKGDISGSLGASANSSSPLTNIIKTTGKGVFAGVGTDFFEKNKGYDSSTGYNNKLGMPDKIFDNVVKGVNSALSAASGAFIGDAVNLLSAIIGGSSGSVVPINLELSANMRLGGSLSSVGSIPSTPISFWAPGTQDLASAPNYIPLYNKPLGVVNFKGKPDIDINHKHMEETYIYDDGSTVLELLRTHDYYDIIMRDYSSYLVINPEVLKIADVTIEKQDLVVEYHNFSIHTDTDYLYGNVAVNRTNFHSWYEPETSTGGDSPKRCGVRFAIRVTPHDGSPSSLILKTFLLNEVTHTTNYINGKPQQ